MVIKLYQGRIASFVFFASFGLAACGAEKPAEFEVPEVGMNSEAIFGMSVVDCPSCLLVTGNDEVQGRLTDGCPTENGWKYFGLVRLDAPGFIRFTGPRAATCNQLNSVALRRTIPDTWGGSPTVILFKKGFRFLRSEVVNVRPRDVRGGGIVDCPVCTATIEDAFVTANFTTNCPTGPNWEVMCLWRQSTGETIEFLSGQSIVCNDTLDYDLADAIPSDWADDDIYIEMTDTGTGDFLGTKLFTVEP